MTQILWRDMFCSRCGRETKHRSSLKGTVSATFSDGKLNIPRPLSHFNNPDAVWTCWSCKSKGILSTTKYDPIEAEPTDACITICPSNERPETENQKLNFMIDQLAMAVSVLEDRLASIEKTLYGKEKRRVIRVKKRK